MHWIVLLAGLAVLWRISSSTGRAVSPVSLSPSMDDALSDHLTAIAREITVRGSARTHIQCSLLKRLEKVLASLHTFPESQLLPAQGLDKTRCCTSSRLPAHSLIGS